MVRPWSRTALRRLALALGCLAAVLAAHPAAAEATAWSFGDWVRGLVGGNGLPDGIVMSNGRLEAEQIAIAAKIAGRVDAVLIEEGDTVEQGAVVARLDPTEIEAQLAGAKARSRQAERSRAEAEAAIAQHKSTLLLAQQEYERARTLNTKGYSTGQLVDQRKSALDAETAALRAAQAGLSAADAALDAAEADVARFRSLLADTILTAPRRGRIEYKLVQSGEVVAAGAAVATMLDLADVYMTVFLPAEAAGPLAIGDEARIILDPVPQYVIPATVSFVSAEAQFTPRSVETAEEREKLMFRVKLRIAAPLLKSYESRVKAGVRGIGYVRLSPEIAWPPQLAVKLPGP